MNVIRHVRIRGRVQGVGFRFFVMQAVRHRRGGNAAIQGWVRNRRDGSVEAVFAGEHDAVSSLIEDCRRGPAGARVSDIEEREADAADLELRKPGEAFSVLGTA